MKMKNKKAGKVDGVEISDILNKLYGTNMPSQQIYFKHELLAVLASVGAKITGEDDEKWLIHFEVNMIPYVCLYDDGISCFSFGKPVYSPLEWGEPYFSELKKRLIATKN